MALPLAHRRKLGAYHHHSRPPQFITAGRLLITLSFVPPEACGDTETGPLGVTRP